MSNAVVKNIKKNLAYVEVNKTASCNGCRACAFGRSTSVVIPAIMDEEVAIGDAVTIISAQKKPRYLLLLVFAIPLIMMSIGIFIGILLNNELITFLLSIVFLIFGLFFVSLLDRLLSRNKKYLSHIKKIDKEQILSTENIIGCSILQHNKH